MKSSTYAAIYTQHNSHNWKLSAFSKLQFAILQPWIILHLSARGNHLAPCSATRVTCRFSPARVMFPNHLLGISGTSSTFRASGPSWSEGVIVFIWLWGACAQMERLIDMFRVIIFYWKEIYQKKSTLRVYAIVKFFYVVVLFIKYILSYLEKMCIYQGEIFLLKLSVAHSPQ